MSFGPGELEALYKDRASNIPERAIAATRALADEPEFDEEAAFFWTAFNDLSGDRPVGFGVAAIPWSAIDRYATRYGLDQDEFDELAYVVRAVDEAWLAHPRNRPQAERTHPQKTRRNRL